jgi:hypothetical protein
MLAVVYGFFFLISVLGTHPPKGYAIRRREPPEIRTIAIIAAILTVLFLIVGFFRY